MSLLFGRTATASGAQQRAGAPIVPAEALIPRRQPAKLGLPTVTNENALRHPAVFACLRLRANLISTMALRVYRMIGDDQVAVNAPPVLVNPGGDRVGIHEWLFSTQVDLDRAGNAFGVISERSGTGLPARIDLVPVSEVSVIIRGGELTSYRIVGREYDPGDIWHEKQYTLPGVHVGLSPIACAAWSIGEYLSIQEFITDWFGNGGVPILSLKNTAKTLSADEAAKIKERYRASTHAGDPFVHGDDWELSPIQAQNAGSEWLAAKKFSVADIARFFDVPGDMIDAENASSHITYANISQRNMQFLIMNLAPAITRRETALSALTPAPRFVKFDESTLLRMDPMARAQLLKQQIDSRTLTPDEARSLDNRLPLTDDQIAQFLTFWPPSRSIEAGSGLESPPPAPTTEEAI